METGNLQTEEKRKARDVKVPLRPKQPHVHLHLSIEVGSMAVAVRGNILIAVLSHLSDGVCNTDSLSHQIVRHPGTVPKTLTQEK